MARRSTDPERDPPRRPRDLDGPIAWTYRRTVSPILLALFGLLCLWAGYRWGKVSAFAEEYEREVERENEEFLNRLRSDSAT